jgi:methionine-rich copper-binding protein CopC
VKISRVGAGVSAGFVLAVILSGPAFAHAALTGTSPASGAESTNLTEVSLTANEDLLDLGGGNGFAISVTDAAGHFYGDGCVLVDGPTATMPVRLGKAGDYAVAYRVVSADGHPIEGAWSFTYNPAADMIAGPAYLELPVCGETPVPVVTAEPEPEPEPEPTVTAMPITAQDDGLAIAPIIGIATTLAIASAIWLLMRSLGKRDSEDHLS